ncbi:hypothetical protein TNCV_4208891 [Trichonephila clavipes]|nr:hypothetical protein TNCV_4208891 [Trichonephila clavipes]
MIFLKRLAGVMGLCYLRATYRTFIKPVTTYCNAHLITISEGGINRQERLQNNALRLITGAVKTTPIDALLLYTGEIRINCTAALFGLGMETIYNCFLLEAGLHIYTDGSKLEVGGVAVASAYYLCRLRLVDSLACPLGRSGVVMHDEQLPDYLSLKNCIYSRYWEARNYLNNLTS